MRKALTAAFLLCTTLAEAQVPFAHEQAIYKDSNIFVNWAVGSTIQRGYQDISNVSLGYATVGDENSVSGKAGLNGVVSLGDGGSAIVFFEHAIRNGAGPDFAIFENAFQVQGDTTFFLELAFVEVSSDGARYVRFPATCDIDTLHQIPNGVGSDTRLVKNLAGKYIAFYGTPFDLEQLRDSAGLDLEHITHVKIIDVVGSLTDQYARRDARGHKINDAWPTPFPSSGFDLEAVGVIHENNQTGIGNILSASKYCPVTFYRYGQDLHLESLEAGTAVAVSDLSGRLLWQQQAAAGSLVIPSTYIGKGLYLLRIVTGNQVAVTKVLIE